MCVAKPFIQNFGWWWNTAIDRISLFPVLQAFLPRFVELENWLRQLAVVPSCLQISLVDSAKVDDVPTILVLLPLRPITVKAPHFLIFLELTISGDPVDLVDDILTGPVDELFIFSFVDLTQIIMKLLPDG